MIDIFIKSCLKDLVFLEKCLESIEKYVTGYDNIILVMPNGTKRYLPREMPKNTKVYEIKEEGNGYLFQQYTKLTAFNYSKADYIMYIDSDCIFCKNININTLIREDGKTEIFKTHYNLVGDAICWKEPTERFFEYKIKADFEYMRRNGMIYRRDTLINLASLKKDLKHYILHSDRFSEFNVLGLFAETFEADKYIFLDTEKTQIPEHFMVQCWSWADPKSNEEIHKIEWKRFIDTCKQYLN